MLLSTGASIHKVISSPALVTLATAFSVPVNSSVPVLLPLCASVVSAVSRVAEDNVFGPLLTRSLPEPFLRIGLLLLSCGKNPVLRRFVDDLVAHFVEPHSSLRQITDSPP